MHTHNNTNGHSQLVNGAIAVKAKKHLSNRTDLITLTPEQEVLWKKIIVWRDLEILSQKHNKLYIETLRNASNNELAYRYSAHMEWDRRNQIETLNHVILWRDYMAVWPHSNVNLNSFRGVKLCKIWAYEIIGKPSSTQIKQITKHGIRPCDLLGNPPRRVKLFLQKFNSQIRAERNRNVNVLSHVIKIQKEEGASNSDSLIDSAKAVRKTFKEYSIGETLLLHLQTKAFGYDEKGRQQSYEHMRIWPGIREYINERYGKKSSVH